MSQHTTSSRFFFALIVALSSLDRQDKRRSGWKQCSLLQEPEHHPRLCLVHVAIHPSTRLCLPSQRHLRWDNCPVETTEPTESPETLTIVTALKGKLTERQRYSRAFGPQQQTLLSFHGKNRAQEITMPTTLPEHVVEPKWPEIVEAKGQI